MKQLQRTIGNQAVNRLLQPGSGGFQRPTVQRRLRVDPEALPSPSGKAKADESTYTLIHSALKAYHNVPRKFDSAAEKKQYSLDRVGWLMSLDKLCRTWLTEHPAGERRLLPGKKAKDAAKRQAVQTLLGEVTKDLIFSGTFQTGGTEQIADSEQKKRIGNALIAGTGSHNFAFVKSARKNLLTAQTPEQKQAAVAGLGDGEPELLATYQDLREKRGLISKEVKAIGAYTADQFRFMNPAGAGGGGWLAGQMAKKDKQTDEKSVTEALEINKVINEVAAAGLRKLPPWKHDRRIYRGETLTKDEAMKIEAGYVKTYPHFVSTSQGLDTPRTMAAANKDDDRPIAVIWHIVESSGGRDIMAISKTSEQEILFPPGTTFTILGVEKTRRGLAKADHMEVRVKAEAPGDF